MHENINTYSEIHNACSSAVEHKRPVLTQTTEVLNFKMPQSKESVRKLLESSIGPNNDRLYVVKGESASMVDVNR